MKPYFALACIVLVGIVPFSSRAVFMDEHIYLRIAKTAQHNWLFPQDSPSVFFGLPTANDVAITHPPVGQYYLALEYMILGRFSEVPFRLLFAVFPIATVLAFYSLARRLTKQPFLVALVFALSPAFFVMSPTLMMDIPMIAFLLAGLAFYFAHLEGRRHALVAATVCWVLSGGTGYTTLVPLGCLFAQMILTRRPVKELLAVVATPMALALWQLAMAVHYGSLPFTRTAGFFLSRVHMLHNAAATLSFLGAVALFPGTILVVSKRPRLAPLAVAIAIATAFAILTASSAWYVALAVSGLIMLTAFIRTAKEVDSNRFLIFWVPAVLLFFIAVGDMMNARYILLALPPIYLVMLRRSTPRQLIFALIPTAALSAALAYADFVFVNSYRNWVQQTVLPLQHQGFRIWGAAESGLRFYLEENGMPTLTYVDLRPHGTDLIVRHDLFKYSLAEDVATMLTVLKRFELNSDFPIQTFNKASGAGFHDSRIGITPFSISRTPLDHVEISQVSPLVATLPQKGIPADEVPAWSPDGVILKQNGDLREFKLKVPADTKLEYEVIGSGKAEMNQDGIVLRRIGSGTIVWRNLRIVPLRFVGETS
jgi:4-amino-4-deoxy-L-arabinose transferase-like glycosyltransferase